MCSSIHCVSVCTSCYPSRTMVGHGEHRDTFSSLLRRMGEEHYALRLSPDRLEVENELLRTELQQWSSPLPGELQQLSNPTVGQSMTHLPASGAFSPPASGASSGIGRDGPIRRTWDGEQDAWAQFHSSGKQKRRNIINASSPDERCELEQSVMVHDEPKDTDLAVHKIRRSTTDFQSANKSILKQRLRARLGHSTMSGEVIAILV